MNENGLPFTETVKENYKIRTFLESVDDNELKWHQDLEDRLVRPLLETNWQIQLDNQLPVSLTPDKDIFIPKYVWHRLIKGTGDLNVKILFK